MEKQANNLKLAERGALIGILSYIFLSIAKLTTGNLLSSSALMADGFNNISDILANLAVLIGLRLARRPADTDHKFGHWKIEDIASLITSFLMFAVGFDVLWDTSQKIIKNEVVAVDPVGAWVGCISALIMFGVYIYNNRLAKQVNSKALKSAAKDNLSDALTSLGTSLAILASALKFPILDKLAAIAITLLILKTAYDIFMESYFTLSDGFDEKHLADYEADILMIEKVTAVRSIRGRTYGSNIYLDIVLEMHPDLSVYESHYITEQVENLLYSKHQVFDIDIHVEPTVIDQDEFFDNVSNKLFRLESQILAQDQDFEHLLNNDYTYINSQGHRLNKAEFLAQLKPSQHLFTHFRIKQISQKTYLITYQLDEASHSSLWRRHESWQQVFHQVSKS